MKRNEFSNNIEDTKKSLEDNFIKKYSKILHYIISYDGLKLNESLEDESELSKINVKCPKGLTALHYAIKYRDSDLCYKLLSIKSIDINLADNNGITPFYMATENDLDKHFHDFKSFYEQYDIRRNKDFRKTFPELVEWYDSIVVDYSIPNVPISDGRITNYELGEYKGTNNGNGKLI